MRLTRWERFWRLDVPSGMISAGMERDAELRRRVVLPRRLGIHLRTEPSLRAARDRLATPPPAIAQANLSNVGLAILVMIVLVIGVNFVFGGP